MKFRDLLLIEYEIVLSLWGMLHQSLGSWLQRLGFIGSPPVNELEGSN